MSAARRMKAPPVKATPRVASPQPCALSDKGCQHNRTKDSIFCYGHGLRIEAWAGKPGTQRKKRLQDLDRWRSFHDYTNRKGSS